MWDFFQNLLPYLHASSLRVFSLLNKQWNRDIRPFLWHSVLFASHCDLQRSHDDLMEFCRVIRHEDRARHIRSLHINLQSRLLDTDQGDDSERGETLRQALMATKNLVRLKVFEKHPEVVALILSWTKYPFRLRVLDAIPVCNNISDFLASQPGIKHLTLKFRTCKLCITLPDILPEIRSVSGSVSTVRTLLAIRPIPIICIIPPFIWSDVNSMLRRATGVHTFRIPIGFTSIGLILDSVLSAGQSIRHLGLQCDQSPRGLVDLASAAREIAKILRGFDTIETIEWSGPLARFWDTLFVHFTTGYPRTHALQKVICTGEGECNSVIARIPGSSVWVVESGDPKYPEWAGIPGTTAQWPRWARVVENQHPMEKIFYKPLDDV